MIIRRKNITIVLVLLIGIICILVGYASISAINLVINGDATATADQSNFDVKFIEVANVSPRVNPATFGSATIVDDTTATFTLSGDIRKGNIITATYKVKNNSRGIGARISLLLTNSNDEYYKVTEHIDDNELQAGDTTTVTVTVEMMENPFEDNQSASITARLTAEPLENDAALRDDYDSIVIGSAESFEADSWGVIRRAVRTNNTSLYNVGDTKTVTINGNEYTLRIVNKSTSANCKNSNYSQTACGLVIEFVDIFNKRQMNSENINTGGWPDSDLYTYLQGTFYNSLPGDLKGAITTTRVISGYGSNDSQNFVTNDKIYLLSGYEVFGNDPGNNNLYDTAVNTTTQLDYYSNLGVSYSTSTWTGTNLDKAVKYYGEDETAWWLRPASANYTTNFSMVSSDGDWASNGAGYTLGVSPAFRIG